MARQDASELLNALAPALQAAAKNVVRHAYGPDGMPWGTRFTDVEDIAVQVGDLLAREVLHVALTGQAARPRPDDLTACPSCSGALDERPDQLRELQSGPGDLAWDEPATYCPRCRRAFFPSGQEPRP
jgi:hypothetical protein